MSQFSSFFINYVVGAVEVPRMHSSPAGVETDSSSLLLGTDVVLHLPTELASSISVCRPAEQREQVV